MTRFTALLLSVSVLAGCVTDEGLTGTGPVTLSDRQTASFRNWARGTTDRDSLYFFLVRGGGVYRVFCPEPRAICRDANEYNWKQKCDAKYGAGACRLYGVYGDVVWKFDAPADPGWWNKHPERAKGFGSQTTDTNSVDVRSVEIDWGGHSGPLAGSLHYRKSWRKYEINLVVPGKTYCDGVAEFTRKTWTMNCRNGVKAEGTFRTLGKDKGSVGEGMDSDGNRIEFRVGPSRS